jgi:hypothetical protein
MVSLKEKLHLLTKSQKTSVSFLVAFLVTLPLLVTVMVNSKMFYRSRADVVTPTTPPNPGGTVFGYNLYLNPVSGIDYIHIPYSLTTILQTGFTVEAWFKADPKSLSDTNPHYIIAKQGADGEASPYALLLANRKIEFVIYHYREGLDPLNFRITGSTTIDPNRWYHIAALSNGNSVFLVLNGNVDQTAVAPGGGIMGSEPPNRDLTIGCMLMTNFPYCLGQFYGEIDEVRISRSPRYYTEIPQTPFTPDEFTTALWHLDQDAQDMSGNGNHGTLVGNALFVTSTIGVTSSPTPTETLTPTSMPTNTPTPTSEPIATPTPTIATSCQTILDKIQATFLAGCENENYDYVVDLNLDTWINGKDVSTLIPHLYDEAWCTNQLRSTNNPCATPTPTLTPTPTPPPGNQAPYITTNSLSAGRVGKSYSSQVVARDKNKDTITMTALNLPSGLSLTRCNLTKPLWGLLGYTQLTCYVSGTPTQQGSYSVKLTATDKYGSYTSKNFPLTVRSK